MKAFISFSRHCWMSRSPVEALADRDQCWPPFSRSDTGTLMDPSHSDRRPGHNLHWSSTQRQNCTSNYFKSTTIKLLLTSCIDTSHWAHSLAAVYMGTVPEDSIWQYLSDSSNNDPEPQVEPLSCHGAAIMSYHLVYCPVTVALWSIHLASK